MKPSSDRIEFSDVQQFSAEELKKAAENLKNMLETSGKRPWEGTGKTGVDYGEKSINALRGLHREK